MDELNKKCLSQACLALEMALKDVNTTGNIKFARDKLNVILGENAGRF